MGRAVTAIFITFILATYYFINRLPTEEDVAEHVSKLFAFRQSPSDHIGDAQHFDHALLVQSALSEQRRFHGATIRREYIHVQQIERTKLWFTSDATITVRYAIEYSFGYELGSGTFSVSGTQDEIVITLPKPILIASPAVTFLSHSIPSAGLLIDEQEAVIALQKQLSATADAHGKTLADDEGVVAICERQLIAFLRDLLSKSTKTVPAIRIQYL